MTQISSMCRLFFAAMMIAVLALPASAAQPVKNYGLVMSATIGSNGIVTATLTNLSPTGNSAINSFIIKRPANTTLSNPYTPTSGVSFTLDAAGNLKINGFQGLLPQDQNGTHTLVISFKVSGTACVNPITWSASVYTGNSWNGDTFALVPGQSSLTSNFPSNACYTIGGTVTGLGTGKSVVLQNNGGNNLTVAANGSFTFTSSINAGGTYVVTVLTQPTGQTCTVNGGSGTNVTANVTSVVVNCATNTYTISGTISGLTGTVVLQNNGANDLARSANGTFTFAAPVPYGGSYAVTVLTQPTGQTCTVSSGSGSNVTANVTGVVVNCATNTYTIGGTVSGLGGGKSVVLQNNGGDNRMVNANVGFTFATPVNYGGSYAVTVLTQPTGQTCTVSNGSGSNVTANVTSVSVTCITNTMAITVPPSANLGDPFTVTVSFTPPNLPPGVVVTLSSSNCTMNPGTGSLSADGSSLTFNQVTISDAPSLQCAITATAAGGAYATANATISPILTGVLGCGEPLGNPKAGNLAINTDPPLAYIGTPDWGLVRAANNKDGNACSVPVPFQFQFDPNNNTAAFIIPDTLGQKVAVEYVLLWSPIPTDTVPPGYPGLPFALAELAWLKDGAGAFKFVPALACVEDDVELGEAIPPAIQPVLPIIPNVEPFISLAGAYPGYAPGQVAKMCVAQEGWTSVGRSGTIKLRQYWHKVIDYADGGARLSN